MNRFYLGAIEGKLGFITDLEEIKHLSKVLRLGPGDQVEVTDGQGGEFMGQISKVSKDQVVLDLIEALPSRELPLVVDLYQGIPKGQKWDYLIQKAVECGITNIHPVQMKRCVSKISDDKSDKKVHRWQKIADEAAKQSKRSIKPLVNEPKNFKDAMAAMADYDLVLTAYENQEGTSLKSYEGALHAADRVAIWIGPEGGLDDQEVENLAGVGKIISLGKRILRTESAALVLLSQIAYVRELT